MFERERRLGKRENVCIIEREGLERERVCESERER